MKNILRVSGKKLAEWVAAGLLMATPPSPAAPASSTRYESTLSQDDQQAAEYAAIYGRQVVNGGTTPEALMELLTRQGGEAKTVFDLARSLESTSSQFVERIADPVQCDTIMASVLEVYVQIFTEPRAVEFVSALRDVYQELLSAEQLSEYVRQIQSASTMGTSYGAGAGPDPRPPRWALFLLLLVKRLVEDQGQPTADDDRLLILQQFVRDLTTLLHYMNADPQRVLAGETIEMIAAGTQFDSWAVATLLCAGPFDRQYSQTQPAVIPWWNTSDSYVIVPDRSAASQEQAQFDTFYSGGWWLAV